MRNLEADRDLKKPFSASHETNIGTLLKTWRWLLPLILSSLAIIYETLEHSVAFKALKHASFWWEIVLFGLIGPLTVGIVLSWVQGQLEARLQADNRWQESLQQLRRAEEEVRQANLDLERKVVERTQSLLEAYQTVAEQNEALKTLDRLKSEFVSLVSHELRAPLTSINGGLELILAFGDDLAPDTRDSLQVMEQESTRLTRLVENILNVSVLEAGQLQLNLGPLALPPLIERTIQCHQVGAFNHRFQVDIEDELPMALADEAFMYEVLYNLIDNAVKYASPQGEGVIKVAAGYGRPKGDGKSDIIWLSVEDNGPGIGPNDRQTIFDPFHRLDGQPNREVYGYGLGLYFTRKLVEAQQGDIWVESEPGRGSRFTLTLPSMPPDLAKEMLDGSDAIID
jgi:signal transduction histidine kinase